MATLAVVPHSLTLYETEDNLLALVETGEMVTAEEEAAYVADLQLALTQAIEKRDRVSQFLVHLETQAALAQQEIHRLKERKEWFEHARDRMEAYVVKVIEAIGPDAKGKFRKLEGKTVTFSIRTCPAAVEIRDESQVPTTCKTAHVKLPADRWESLLDSLDLETRALLTESAKVEYEVSKTRVKEAIDAKEEVPGADLKIGTHSLVRK